LQKPKIILASGSPRRKQLLQLINIPFEVVVSNADEKADGDPDEIVQELASRKARAVLSTLAENEDHIVIAADTLVYINGKVLGKPRDEKDAIEMLKQLSGKLHMVYTGVSIIRGDYEHVFADRTRVYFRTLPDEEIIAYVKTGEPLDKAGAYGVQERGSVLVERIDGDFYTVVGLPVAKVSRALAVMGYDIWEGGEQK
jgi:septum formation protein